MEIKILGPGCAKCNKLYELALRAVEDTGADATIAKVTALDQDAAYGAVFLPGLVVDGELKSSGKVPRAARIAQWIREAEGGE